MYLRYLSYYPITIVQLSYYTVFFSFFVFFDDVWILCGINKKKKKMIAFFVYSLNISDIISFRFNI